MTRHERSEGFDDRELGGVARATVVIPTRGRPQGAVRAVSSVLRGDLSPAELVVVDQSEDEDTRRALEALTGDPVRYVHTPEVGISVALNRGIGAAESETIAITGDDCEASPEWLAELLAELSRQPAIGVVFGSILPGPCDPSAGFAPSYAPEHVTVSRLSEKHRVAGTTACMALRRSVWESLGGFDESLGIGSPFRSAEDADFTIRVLAAGVTVSETPKAAVVHHGFYMWSERARLIERNWYGTGATFAKSLRLRHPGMPGALLWLGLSWFRGRSKIAAGLGTGSHRRASLRAFLRGARAGLRAPLDRRRGHFRL